MSRGDKSLVELDEDDDLVTEGEETEVLDEEVVDADEGDLEDDALDVDDGESRENTSQSVAKVSQQRPHKEKKPTDKLADRSGLTKFLQSVFGDAQKRVLKRLWKRAKDIGKLEPKYEAMSDEELKEQSVIFREKIQKALAQGVKDADGQNKEHKRKKKTRERDDTKILNEILPDAFAVAREASKRVLGMRPYDVQLIGGMVLNEGAVAEMKTGEGKTLVAMLPAYLNGLTGRGVHVVTVNDYLAQRDAGWNGPVYDFLGLTVAVIVNNASFIYDKDFENTEHADERFLHLRPCTRKEAYAADVTYGTNNEFGFDYLRDNMTSEVKYLRQRELNFAIVDEVDSILIDEARTPLIISAPAGDNPEAYYQFAKIAARLTPDDYVFDEKRRSVTLTDQGIEKVQEMLGVDNLYSTKNTRLVYHLEQAIRAEIVFKRDKDYVVTNSGDVVIVDEHTGRLMQGRRYNEGLHQAIEAKEGVAVKQESMTLATISFQNFFRLYKKLSGMTGTAFTEAEEFQQIYALDVIQIPPNRPIQRVDKDDLIYKTKAGKLKAIAEEIKKYHAKGQPVLVGSGSIANNEEIARYLDHEGIQYEILNAKNNEREAAIIAKAGEKGAITLATNMAGRGTDIKLGEGVAELGGLVVIGSERHDSRRVDNQLRGRGGRQGDPGTTQFFVSCEDDLMRIFQGDRVKMLMMRLGVPDDVPIQTKSISKTLEAAQKRIEGFNFDSRKNVVQYDNVINRHRKVVYLMRRKILMGEDIHSEIERLMRDETKMLTADSSRVNKNFDKEFKAVFDFDENLIHGIGVKRKEAERAKLAYEAVKEAYQKKEEEFGEETMRKIEREVYLKVLDVLWMQHLENMQHLREGIHWRSVGQRDPLVEYRSESQKLFDNLQRNLREEVLKILLTVTPSEAAEEKITDGEEYDSELTKMAESQTEKGVNEISKGDRNLDNEFKKPSGKSDKTNVTVRTIGGGASGVGRSATKKSSSKRKKKNKKRK
ncbi:preprotein translocase subunit SecA [Candidatus Saccharibacteria bacterium]|nr:preprotein translocase subunit SecA [Candidatus Saccharibacteria bacterium]